MSEKVNVLTFENLNYKVKNLQKETKGPYAEILSGFTGKAESGQLTAVMGTSGCGKTHLLKLLVGDIEEDAQAGGNILYNGEIIDPIKWMNKITYLPQENVYYPELTIYETLVYYLNLSKKDKSTSIEDKAMEIMRDCGIENKKHALCSSLSGGELKRAMISLALTKQPEIVFLDEPTSGLDSLSAMIIISNLKKYAANNNSIVFITLHQPGTAIFNMVDHLIFMVPHGLFYSGNITKIPKFLESYGIVKDESISLSEYLFLLAAGDIPKYKLVFSEIVETNEKILDRSGVIYEYKTTYAASDEMNFNHVLQILKTSFRLYWRRASITTLLFDRLYVILMLIKLIFSYFSITPAALADRNLGNISLFDFFIQNFSLYMYGGFIICIGIITQKGIDLRDKECFKLEIITGKYSYASYLGFLYLQKVLVSLYYFIISYSFLIGIVQYLRRDAKYLILPAIYYLCVLGLQLFWYMLFYAFITQEYFLGTLFLLINMCILSIPTSLKILLKELLDEYCGNVKYLVNFYIISTVGNLELIILDANSSNDEGSKNYISQVFDFPINKVGLLIVICLTVFLQMSGIYAQLKRRIIPKIRCIKK